MQKKVLLPVFLFFLLISSNGFGDIEIYDGNPAVKISTINSDYTQNYRVGISIDSFTVKDVQTPNGKFAQIILDDSGYTQKIGAPMLPVIRRFVQIPLGASIDLEWKGKPVELPLSDYSESAYILPKQPPVPKCQNDKEPPFILDENSYLLNRAILDDPAVIVNTGIVRGHRFAVLEVRPINYNPSRGSIYFYKNLEVTLNYNNPDWEATRTSMERYADMRISAINSNSFLNPFFSEAKTSVGYDVPSSYLVIGAKNLIESDFFGDWVEWKTQKGFNVRVVDAQDAGGSAVAIRDYIYGAYASWQYPPNFLLLVGDTDTIPHMKGNGTANPATDLYYSTVDGSDMYADIGVGRFPAKNVEQLGNMVRKTLEYEKALWPGTDHWLESMALMASQDRSWVTEGTQDWVCSTILEPAGIECEKYYNRQGATSQQVLQAINSGQNMVIYTGHGDVNAWIDGPVIYAGEVYGLLNTVYPFVSSYACLTGQYEADECFSETWLRAPNAGVAMWASSVSSFWDEDDVLERAQMWGLFNGTQIPEKIEEYIEIPWFSGFCDFAKIVLDLWASGGESTLRYFEMYNLMGDPETMAWTMPPLPVDVSHKSYIGIPASSVDVQVDRKDGGDFVFALVGISSNGQLLGSSLVHPGQKSSIQLFSEVDEEMTATLVVTGHNLEPYIATITFSNDAPPEDDDDSTDDDITEDDDSDDNENGDRDEDDEKEDDSCGC